MHGNAELKSLTNTGGLNTGANSAPERGVEQDHVNGRVEHISRQLFEIDDHRVRRERNANLLSDASHSIHAKHRIFQVIVSDRTHVLDSLTKPDRRFGGPNTVRIKPKTLTLA